MASSFNVVIGRPTLTEIRAVVSQSHLCMKFPTPMGIATLRGNQEVARHCYITSVRQPKKGKDQAPEVIPQWIPDNQQVMGVEIVDNRPKDEPRAAPIEDVEEVLIDERDPSRKTQIGTRLNPEERTELIAFLRANNDVFAWTSADMPGIPPSGGEASGYKRREEVEKLLQAGFVRKVDYCEWVANLVLVKKANGKWRMCIDYTNLNQACPKDYYPMSSIDRLVEAASGNERLSLLDAYYGYHQVLMAPEDEEKTSFYVGDEIYCYVMMPFGLKNAGATYQKMVTIIFRAQISRNLEVYVEDIVVKSLKAEDHLADLDETFNNLRKNRMRLNPAKCIFGVESGKFLGFMVSRRGIEVNPEKIRAIIEMEPLKSIKDIQRLTGRVATLHRFISKSVDKCLPFFKIMSFGEKRNQAAETNLLYQQCTARSRAEILQKPECSGRLIKWAVELGEFEITFQQRSAIRGQVLADFIVECTPCPSTSNPEPNDWTLYVDGASSSKGSGAGTLLIGLEGYRSEHALKFNFDATNNMAEYKALLLGLQLALDLGGRAEMQIPEILSEQNSPTKNEQANSVSKFASDSSLSSRSVFIEVLDEPSFMKPRMMEISTDPDTSSWTHSIISFLRDGIVLEDRQEAMKLRKKASRYTLVDGEVHEGVCGSHGGARTLAHKVLRQGYCWPNMHKDATYFVQKCPKCQFFAHLTHQPAEELTNLVAPWPFAQWGLDLLGPFVKGVGVVTHLVVGVDYFTKWAEARPLSSLTSKKVEDFVFSSIICRYGIPNQIVADNGTQFNCSSFRDFCSSYGIKLQFTSVYHLESNGMVESVNKCILEGIKPRLEQHKAKWADELNNVLWAYRTTSRTATGETPYHLDFGTELLRENLDLLAEVREEARLRTLVYKQKLANFYNKRVRPRTFKVGDLVLRKAGLTGFETHFGKLASNWEGPYTVAEVPHPGAYVLQDAEGKRVPRVWNVNNLKKFYP
ncbi:hypothetical protein SLEP1_g17794 [Rubroshorea leprosula]|uniref:Integrase catalytic domain-containing protein n=1 Tax=Rubroshorea leprosula TaxID=152421 RepID=A0AAV5IZ16_9ROSI|nr:hypothetical protein SLEP1_g17794 [Rubroshorea leprosula]